MAWFHHGWNAGVQPGAAAEGWTNSPDQGNLKRACASPVPVGQHDDPEATDTPGARGHVRGALMMGCMKASARSTRKPRMKQSSIIAAFAKWLDAHRERIPAPLVRTARKGD